MMRWVWVGAATAAITCAGSSPAQGPSAAPPPTASSSAPRDGDVIVFRTAGQPERRVKVLRISGNDLGDSIADVQDQETGAKYSVPAKVLATMMKTQGTTAVSVTPTATVPPRIAASTPARPTAPIEPPMPSRSPAAMSAQTPSPTGTPANWNQQPVQVANRTFAPPSVLPDHAVDPPLPPGGRPASPPIWATSSATENDVVLIRTAGQPERRVKVLRISTFADGEALADMQDLGTGAKYTIPAKVLAGMLRAAPKPVYGQPSNPTAVATNAATTTTPAAPTATTPSMAAKPRIPTEANGWPMLPATKAPTTTTNTTTPTTTVTAAKFPTSIPVPAPTNQLSSPFVSRPLTKTETVTKEPRRAVPPPSSMKQLVDSTKTGATQVAAVTPSTMGPRPTPRPTLPPSNAIPPLALPRALPPSEPVPAIAALIPAAPALPKPSTPVVTASTPTVNVTPRIEVASAVVPPPAAPTVPTPAPTITPPAVTLTPGLVTPTIAPPSPLGTLTPAPVAVMPTTPKPVTTTPPVVAAPIVAPVMAEPKPIVVINPTPAADPFAIETKGPVPLHMVRPPAAEATVPDRMMEEMQPFIRELESASRPTTRERAASALAESRYAWKPEIKAIMAKAAQNDPSPDVRAHCVKLLSKLGYHEPTYIQFLEASADAGQPVVKAAAVAALAKLTPK